MTTVFSKKRIFSFFVAFAIILTSFGLLLASSCGNAAFARAEELTGTEPGGASLKIDNSLLQAGEEISVTADFDIVSLRWYVDGEFVSDELSYAPTANDYEKWISAEAYDGETLIARDSVYFSKIPVIYINTDDGEAVTEKGEYKPATMKVQNNDVCAYTEYDDIIEIKGRGNSSWSWPKKPYKIKLDSKTNMFGMGKNKHWVLLANYLDECFLRNRTGFDIANRLGLLSMDSEWVDVVMNGTYVGNYLLCEHIRVGSDRVDIFDWESEGEEVAGAVYKAEKSTLTKDDKSNLETLLAEDLSWVTTGEFEYNGKTYTVSDYYDLDRDISGGYLLEFSDEYDEVSKFTTENGLKVMLNKPEFLATNDDMMEYLADYIQNFENAYRSINGYTEINGVDRHYTELVDFDSMVSFWLVNEIMGNQDSSSKSRYAYLDFDSKLTFGPVWDFDWGAGSSAVEGDPTQWKASKASTQQNFFKEFADDPLFVCKASEKYWEIRDYLVSIVEEDGIMDERYDYLCESGQADAALWDRSVTFAAAGGFESDYSAFKDYLTQRIEWLDTQFASDSALLDSLRSASSAMPYYKSDNKLAVSVINGVSDNAEPAKAPADYVVNDTDDAAISIEVNERVATKLEIYVNGLYYSTESIPADRNVFAMIDSSALTEECGKKNVISLIARNTDGEGVCTNFVTVKKSAEYIDDTCSHAWSEWTITDEAIADRPGTRTRTCRVCGEIDTEEYYLTLSGVTGDCTWTFAGDTLTISGSGAMADYTNAGNIPPWQEELRSYIKHIVIEDGVTYIGNRAFRGCNKAIDVTFGKDVVLTGYECFYKCSNLTDVSLNEGLTQIGSLCFYDCAFTSVELPSTLQLINVRAFKACSKLESIDIPDSVTYLGYEVFMDCASLTDVELPAGAAYLNSVMFSGCSALETITIPANIARIRTNAFADCTALVRVVFEDDDYLAPTAAEPMFASTAFSGHNAELTFVGWVAGKAQGYAISHGLRFEAKNSSAFKYTLNADGETATITGMRGDSTTANIPVAIDGYTVTAIGSGAFRNSQITSVVIPNTVTTIGGRAFQDSKLIAVVIPSSVNTVNYSAFQNCTSLTLVVAMSSDAAVNNTAFTGCTRATVYAPAGSAAANAAAAAGAAVVNN